MERNTEEKNSQEIIVNHLKKYGFCYQNSEIYNGLANAWDFGPIGSILKNNLKNIWIKYFVTSSQNVFLIDTNIILNSLVWKASGHIDNFSDPLIDCKKCKSRYRADKLIEQYSKKSQINELTPINVLEQILETEKIKCPKCGDSNWTNIRYFNLMFKTNLDILGNEDNIAYLRPETAQGIFINFKNVQRTTRSKLPFGIAQIGKSFRNEITPGNFIFRTKEFEQMEIEFFVREEQENKFFDFFQKKIYSFLKKELNINMENISIIKYPKNELAHYSKQTIDFFYNFPHGKSELWGIANRGNFDLLQHQNLSKKNLEYQDDIENKKYLPSVIEPSVGVERLLYAIIVDSFKIDKINNEERIYLNFNYKLSPYKIAILPLHKKLNSLSNKIYKYFLKKNISCIFDKSGSIGKRYRRQDAIGTFFCLTIDFKSINDNNMTIRYRDDASQRKKRFSKEEILNILIKKGN